MSACSTSKSPIYPTETTTPEHRWQTRLDKLSELEDWRIKARIGIIAEQESGSASLYWEQRKDHYSIKIVAPLGKSLLRITGNDREVLMQNNDGQEVVASSAEELIWRGTGWLIPVEGLASWALGKPDQRMVNDYQLDVAGRLETLKTSGWTIEYLSYQNIHGIQLPKKIHMQNERLKIKLLIKNWELL